MNYTRIKKNNEFQKIFGKGKRVFSSRLTLLYFPSNTLKMGVCVGKKHGGSVERNHVKRLLREIFRLHAENLEQKYCYVLLPKAAEEYSYHALEKDFLYLVKKHGLYLSSQKKEGE